MALSKPLLGYWDIRGLAAPIRYLLEYLGVDYDEKLYKCGPPPTFDRAEWLAEKFNLGLDFPNLPYYFDGNVKLSQSLVIMRYIARKHNLVAKNEADLLRVELAEATIRDYHMDLVRVIYDPQFKERIDPHLETIPGKFEALTKFLGNLKFVAGDYVTYIDFYLFELLEVYFRVESDLETPLVSKHPTLVEYHKRIFSLPAIDKYIKSDRFIKYPFNGAPALLLGQYSEQLNK